MKLLAKPSICQTIYGPVKNMRWIENAFSQKSSITDLGHCRKYAFDIHEKTCFAKIYSKFKRRTREKVLGVLYMRQSIQEWTK